MKTLIFATNNQNKVKEVQSILNTEFSILSLEAAKIFIDIPEPHDSLEKNATEKSTLVSPEVPSELKTTATFLVFFSGLPASANACSTECIASLI